jgi:hypothetical protein
MVLHITGNVWKLWPCLIYESGSEQKYSDIFAVVYRLDRATTCVSFTLGRIRLFLFVARLAIYLYLEARPFTNFPHYFTPDSLRNGDFVHPEFWGAMAAPAYS